MSLLFGALKYRVNPLNKDDLVQQLVQYATELQKEKERSVSAAVEFDLRVIFKVCCRAVFISKCSADVGCGNHPSAKQ